jgi:hypothetical protein
MARGSSRTQPCDLAQARSRLRQATALVDAAELVLEFAEADDVATPGVAASLAVLSGIAASDAVCCAKLRSRSRGQNHRDAVPLLRSVVPLGAAMAKDLERLVLRKDNAHYGMAFISDSEARTMVAWARRLEGNAQKVIEAV